MSSRQRRARENAMTADRWLFNMATKLRPWLRENGYDDLPGNVEYSCGFTRSKHAAAAFYFTGARGPAAPPRPADQSQDNRPPDPVADHRRCQRDRVV